ncbi:MAG: ankyrin repeat domain-containing protein [Candidatus Micrarchaeia archaeon]
MERVILPIAEACRRLKQQKLRLKSSTDPIELNTFKQISKNLGRVEENMKVLERMDTLATFQNPRRNEIEELNSGIHEEILLAGKKEFESILPMLLDPEEKIRWDFFRAVEKGDLNGVLKGIENRADPNSLNLIYNVVVGIMEDPNSMNALMVAVIQDNPEMIKLLYDKGAKIDKSRELWGRTEIMLAADFGHIKSLSALYDLGANLESKDYVGRNSADWVSIHIFNLNEKKRYGKIDVETADKEIARVCECAFFIAEKGILPNDASNQKFLGELIVKMVSERPYLKV